MGHYDSVREDNSFGYLVEEAVSAQSEVQEKATLEDIETYAAMYDKFAAEVEDLSTQLNDAKKKLLNVSQRLLPEAFISLGISSIRLADGREFGYKEDVSCTVLDFNKFEKFLEDQGDSSIIKTQLEVGKIPRAILKKMTGVLFETFGVLCEPKQTVHSQTLAKYVRELCGIGGKSEAVMSLEEIDSEMLKAYVYYKTTVKTKK